MAQDTASQLITGEQGSQNIFLNTPKSRQETKAKKSHDAARLKTSFLNMDGSSKTSVHELWAD